MRYMKPEYGKPRSKMNAKPNPPMTRDTANRSTLAVSRYNTRENIDLTYDPHWGNDRTKTLRSLGEY